MSRLSIAAFLSLTVVFFSCNNCIEGVGDSIEEKRILTDFEELVLNCSADVTIRQNILSEKNSVIVLAQENLIPHLKTTVQSGRLTIDVDGCVNPTTDFVVEVFTNGLSSINVNGSGDVSSTNPLKGESLEINVDGSGDVNLKIKVDELGVFIDGSGDVTLDGDATDCEINSDGSGDFNGFGMKVNNAEIQTDGSGNVNIHVKESLEVNLSGSGNVSYKGGPQEIQQSNSGSGNIKSVN